MQKDEYIGKFMQDLTEDQSGGVPSDFGAEEELDIYSHVLDKLSEIKTSEDNEDLIEDVHTMLENISEDYEQASSPEEWNEVLVRLEEEVLKPLGSDDIEAADVNWPDIKIELMRLQRS